MTKRIYTTFTTRPDGSPRGIFRKPIAYGAIFLAGFNLATADWDGGIAKGSPIFAYALTAALILLAIHLITSGANR